MIDEDKLKELEKAFELIMNVEVEHIEVELVDDTDEDEFLDATYKLSHAVPELIVEIRRQRKALGTFVEELEKAEEEAAGLEYRAEDAEDKLARVREVLGRSNQGLGQNTLLALTIIDEPTGDGGVNSTGKFKELPCRGRLVMQSLDWYCTEETGLRCKSCGKPVCYTCQRFDRHRDCGGVGCA